MKLDRLTIYWFAFCVFVGFVYFLTARGTDLMYTCEGPGWMIRTTESELKRPALLVIGTLTDGRRVALPKAHIRECKVVAE